MPNNKYPLSPRAFLKDNGVFGETMVVDVSDRCSGEDEKRKAFLRQTAKNIAEAPPLSPVLLAQIHRQAAIYKGRLEEAQRREAYRLRFVRYTG